MSIYPAPIPPGERLPALPEHAHVELTAGEVVTQVIAARVRDLETRAGACQRTIATAEAQAANTRALLARLTAEIAGWKRLQELAQPATVTTADEVLAVLRGVA